MSEVVEFNSNPLGQEKFPLGKDDWLRIPKAKNSALLQDIED